MLDIQEVNYGEIVEVLRRAFSSNEHTIPERNHYDLGNSNVSLIMPAWNQKYFGLKQIIACPGNQAKGLPTIQGKYNLFDVQNGKHLTEIDAGKLTAIRTAATSVLASSFFVMKPKNLLVMGNGVIGKHLKEAYNDYYDLDRTVIWSRSISKSNDLEREIGKADIISCASHAYEPILHGRHLSQKVHIDLVGSYKPNMREADDEVIQSSEVYIDDWPATKESGDLAIPIAKGKMTESDIRATLFELCKKQKVPSVEAGRTVFKSVGHALEDLAVAAYFYESYF